MSRILPRFTQPQLTHDPLAILIAQQEARTHAAQQAIANGTHTPTDPTNLRGIPCIARGVGGTSPNTDPLRETIRRDQRRRNP